VLPPTGLNFRSRLPASPAATTKENKTKRHF
jgi:hypothetical protein